MIDGLPVTEIDGRAFENCEDLVSITLPESITHIGHEAFSNCKSLASLIIPNGVT